MDLNEESIPVPSDATYRLRKEAFNALKHYGIRFRYGFRIESSRPYGSRIKTRIYYSYNKARQYTSKARVRKKITTKADNCPFRLVIYQEDSQWKPKVLNQQHSHGPSLDPSTHQIHRRRTPTQKSTSAEIWYRAKADLDRS